MTRRTTDTAVMAVMVAIISPLTMRIHRLSRSILPGSPTMRITRSATRKTGYRYSVTSDTRKSAGTSR
jgi:hypothetical protein